MKKIIHTQGTRKQAVARATLTPGTGRVIINGVDLHNYSSDVLRLRIAEPLVLVGETANTLNFDIKVNGGGINGQADAIRLAMARALVEHDNKLKKDF